MPETNHGASTTGPKMLYENAEKLNITCTLSSRYLNIMSPHRFEDDTVMVVILILILKEFAMEEQKKNWDAAVKKQFNVRESETLQTTSVQVAVRLLLLNATGKRQRWSTNKTNGKIQTKYQRYEYRISNVQNASGWLVRNARTMAQGVNKTAPLIP